MPRSRLPIEALSPWAGLNDVAFLDVKVVDTRNSGWALVSERTLSTREDTYAVRTLITVPSDLVLNAETVKQYAPEHRSFRQLLDLAGAQGPTRASRFLLTPAQSTRGNILLFLLVQTALASAGRSCAAGISSPWTGYFNFLPQHVPVPTLWIEDEKRLLRGTSLETAVEAKLTALEAEFNAIREVKADLSLSEEQFWGRDGFQLCDWGFLDAPYRSRCLELPRQGAAMVPCIDFANHSPNCNAHYDETSTGQVSLLLRGGVELKNTDEVTIDNGTDKPPAEMLFAHGSSEAKDRCGSAVSTLEPLSDDPLAQAKLSAFKKHPNVRVGWNASKITWASPFAYLICLKEENGLEFRMLLDKRGHAATSGVLAGPRCHRTDERV